MRVHIKCFILAQGHYLTALNKIHIRYETSGLKHNSNLNHIALQLAILITIHTENMKHLAESIAISVLQNTCLAALNNLHWTLIKPVN